jgi:gamma-glutamyl:cysteine ligase YbdK (ATP-grasp superfamily)
MTASYHLFERFGVELEYMLVHRDSLAVLPATDEVIKSVAGAYDTDVDVGELTWSNELVLHVIELKTNGPAPTLDGLAPLFQRDLQRINGILAPRHGQLMPTGMHPWMDPLTETKLWPHEYNAVYAAFDRIFNCKGHGWANLQSMHLNLPFAGDEEFGRLHAAIRLLLPILPALAASSPVVDGRLTGVADTRLEVYRSNARKIPSVSGKVIPEPVFTRHDYEAQILKPIYKDLTPFDPQGVLQHEWANARGAIARFERDTIEIRVLDIQECPRADLAILKLIVATLQALVTEKWCPFEQQRQWAVAPLEDVFLATVRQADQAHLTDEDYLALFGFTKQKHCTAGELWAHIYKSLFTAGQRKTVALAPLNVILKQGCLARRIEQALAGDDRRAKLTSVYGKLCTCLAEGQMFEP